MNPGAVKAFYEDLYPNDPAKRQALEPCFMSDHSFDRLHSAERDTRYRRMMQPLGAISAANAAPNRPNAQLVDLQHAAGQRGMPRNDIRRIEQNEHPPHALH